MGAPEPASGSAPESAAEFEQRYVATAAEAVEVGAEANVVTTAETDAPELTHNSARLIDGFGRIHTDLRISITDRCNLRCTYCIPNDDVTFRPRAEILSYDEIARVARVARNLGVSSIRITGGEPLVRRGVVDLVKQLSLVGFEDISLTTNAMALAPLAVPLARAGLSRINVSLDSLDPGRFAMIRRRGDLETVLSAIDVAEAAGLSPVKINVVLRAGVNDHEILDFAAYARSTRRSVRFIEYMPLDAGATWTRSEVVPSAKIIDVIHQQWPLLAIDPMRFDHAPANRYRFLDGDHNGSVNEPSSHNEAEIAVISSVTAPFCGNCNRLRLTADGAIRNCLFSDNELSVRDAMRSGANDEAVADLFRQSVGAKREGHGIGTPSFTRPRRSKSMIGG